MGNQIAVNIERETILLFLRMVGDFSTGKMGEYGDCASILDQLLYLAGIHSLGPAVYYMLKGQREKLSAQKPDQMARMKKAYHSAIYVSLTQETSMEEIQETFFRAEIPLAFFKGAQLRKLYPVPELRTMGDLDCLIRQEDRAKAHQLMGQLGYCCEIDSEPVWVYHRDGVVIEMHTQVAGGGLGNGFDYQAYFSNAINHVVGQDGRLYLEREYHFCYLIYHIAKHLCSTGAGVRMIADIAAFLHQCKDQMDWKRVERMLQESHLWKTATAVYGLCQRWFGLEPPTPWIGPEQILDDLEAYIVTGGTFGFETHDTGDVYRRNALRGSAASSGWRYRFRLLREYFFPPKAYFVKYFPLSERHAWLLPVAWVRRCWEGAFHRKGHSLATIRSMTEGDAQRSYREVLMLREIDL